MDREMPRGEHVGHKPSGTFYCHPDPHGRGKPYKRDEPNPACDLCVRIAAWWASDERVRQYVDGVRRVSA